MRIDAQLNSGSRMSHYQSMAIVDFTDGIVLPAPSRLETPISGYPEGFWINLVTWSPDSRHIAFTLRSPGELLNRLPSCGPRPNPYQWGASQLQLAI